MKRVVKEWRAVEKSSLVAPSCVRTPRGFFACLTEEIEVVDTEDLARQADEWNRHNRWRRGRVLDGGKRQPARKRRSPR